MRKILLSACAVALAGLFLAARPALAEPLPMLVSIAPQKYVLERIAGDALAVTVLVRPGSDPHSYEPSPSQIREASRASLWFTIGVPFEDAWAPRIQGAARSLETFSFISGIKRLGLAEHDHGHEHGHGHEPHMGEDPHVWLSPMLVRKMLPDLARKLAKRLPERAGEFRDNTRRFALELEALDQELAARFAEIPEDKRVFLTFHPSWSYFAHNYQITELCIEVEGKEPGPRTLQGITDMAKAYGIRTIFVEPQFPKTAARAIAETLGADLVEVDPLAEDLIRTYRDVADKLIHSFQ